jgi:hypothetical protein
MSTTNDFTHEGQQPSDIEHVIIQVYKTQGKMKAVKTYTDITGQKLKTSVEAVNAIATKYNLARPAGSGCVGVLAIGIFALLLTYILWI